MSDLASLPSASPDAEPRTIPVSDEATFFTSYDWCLNPLQTFDALCARAQEEIARRGSLEVAWQREESCVNLYLLLCAACCTIDDYLAHRPCDLSPVARRLPNFGRYIRAAESGVNGVARLLRSGAGRGARELRDALAGCVDQICEILVRGGGGHALAWTSLQVAMRRISCAGLPSDLLSWQSRIPEAFRCQDMSHLDVFSMAKCFLDTEGHDGRPILILGLRTAGAYFAPLLKAFLTDRRFPVVGWMSVRPKIGLSSEERARFLDVMAPTTRLLVVDDHPNTGATFGKVLELCAELGIPSERVVILAPDHPAQLDWSHAARNARRVILPFDELHKQKLLQDTPAIDRILRELYRAQGWSDASVQASEQVDRLNAKLARAPDSFEVRLKRAYRVTLRRGDAPPTHRTVLAKSVGWGWLGYHSVLASLRLAEFVPPLVGLRHGLLFSEWVGGTNDVERPPVEQIKPLIADYVAARVNRLRLDQDPNGAVFGGRPAGWDSLLRILRQPYGRILGRLSGPRLRKQLAGYRAPRPALVDGRMAPDEWVISETGIVKADFEHHNFGGAQLDVVDGCYDLACAIRDLDITGDDEEAMVAQYSRQTGDADAADRLPLYKLLSGVTMMRTAAYCVTRSTSREGQDGWNASYNRARDFLNFEMARHSARGSSRHAEPPHWSSKLFFIDVDGVLDAEFFGPLFQHTTPTGVEALSLLKANGHSVVLNTGRSVEHVRRYCEIYALPGALAEYGSVFFDAVRNVELPLADDEAQRQFARCRSYLERMPGVFVDPGYRWSLRAYRYAGELTVGLDGKEIAALIAAHNLDRLDCIAREADTHIVQKGVDKGSGIAFVKRYLSVQSPVAAIGDSMQDLCMFEQADIAYVPANFVPAFRNALRGTKFRQLRTPRQHSLLEAARDLTRQAPPRDVRDVEEGGHLLDSLLSAAEQSRRRRLFHLIRAPARKPVATRLRTARG